MRTILISLMFFVNVCVSSSSIEVEWTKSNSKDVEGYILTYGTSLLSTTLKVGYTHSYVVEGLLEEREYWFTVQSYSKTGNYGPISDAIKFKIPKKEEVRLKDKPVLRVKRIVRR